MTNSLDTEDDFRPWRRHALEPQIRDDDDAAWSAFEAYLVAHARNLGRVAQQRRLLRDTVFRWAKLYAWEARARAYDAHHEAIRDEATEVAAAEWGRIGAEMAFVGAREIAHIARAQTQIDRPGVLRPSEARAYVETGVKICQLVSGRATERIATEEPDLSRLTDEELATLRELTARARGA